MNDSEKQKIVSEIYSRNPEKADFLSVFFAMLPGAIYRIGWTRPMKLRKDSIGHTAIKSVSAIVRSGIDYDSIARVQEKREAGILPSENAGLPWGEWILPPRVILHKGLEYLRFATAPNMDFAPFVSFELDGKPSNDAELAPLCLASEFRDNENGLDVFTLKLATLKTLERVS